MFQAVNRLYRYFMPSEFEVNVAEQSPAASACEILKTDKITRSEVHHVRNVHYAPGISEETKEIVAHHQWHVLKILVEKRVRHLMLEGSFRPSNSTETFHEKRNKTMVTREQEKEIEKYFTSTVLAEDATPHQLDLFKRVPAYVVHISILKRIHQLQDLHLYSSTTKELYDKQTKYRKRWESAGNEYDRLLKQVEDLRNTGDHRSLLIAEDNLRLAEYHLDKEEKLYFGKVLPEIDSYHADQIEAVLEKIGSQPLFDQLGAQHNVFGILEKRNMSREHKIKNVDLPVPEKIKAALGFELFQN
jgi:hypothetical protein